MKQYLVGGAVRDMLLGREPKDRDWLLVGTTQENIADLLASGFQQVGKDFPVFLHPTTGEEFALARVERKSGVGYHGFEAHFDEHVTLEEDLARRDLTINAMAMDNDGQLFDPFNGQADLLAGVLRHTTLAFAEDPLRVIRLARFASRYAAADKPFTIAPETVELAKQMVNDGELNHLSNERFFAELQKVLYDEDACHERFFQVLQALGVFDKVTFFKKLFSGAVAAHSAALHLKSFSAQDRLDLLLVAAATSPEAVGEVGGPSNIQQALRFLKTHGSALAPLLLGSSMPPLTPRNLENALSACRAWQNSPLYQLVMKHMQLNVELGLIEPQQLLNTQVAAMVGAEITAAKFPEFSGIQLGAAIREARVQAITAAFT